MNKFAYLFTLVCWNMLLSQSAAFVPATKKLLSSLSQASRISVLAASDVRLSATKKEPLPDRVKKNHEKWQPYFDLLSQFKGRHGHCNVTEADDHGLYMWLDEQRVSYRNLKLGRKTKLTKTRAAALEMIGAIPAELLEM
jgi:Helicase associated domain